MHQLISLDPLERITTAIGSFPARRSTGNPAEWSAPDGHAYVPIVAKPEFDPETEIAERALTADSDGWIVRDLTEQEIEDRKPKPGPVTRRQFWLAMLHLLELRQSDIEAMYAENAAALIEIRDALEVDPNHPLVTELATELDKSQEEIDALFLYAATL